MLDMGIVAARQLSALKEVGRNIWRVLLVAWVLPQVWGLTGIMGMYVLHLMMPGLIAWGDAFVFATIAGGCSFVTAPAAMRIAIPEANPSIYLPLSVALTFPFNIMIGIPMWQILSMLLYAIMGCLN